MNNQDSRFVNAGGVSLLRGTPSVIGKPVEAMIQVGTELNKRYHQNKQAYIDQDVALSKIPTLIDEDKTILSGIQSEIKNSYDSIIKDDNWQHAENIIMDTAHKVAKDEGLNTLIKNYQSYQANNTAIDAMEGVPQAMKDLRKAKNLAIYKEQGGARDKDGKYQSYKSGSMQSKADVQPYIDRLQKAMSLLKSNEGSYFKEAGKIDFTGVTDPKIKPFLDYVFAENGSVEELTEEKITTFARRYFESDPEFNATVQEINELTHFKNTGNTSVTKQDLANYLSNYTGLPGSNFAEIVGGTDSKNIVFNNIISRSNNFVKDYNAHTALFSNRSNEINSEMQKLQDDVRSGSITTEEYNTKAIEINNKQKALQAEIEASQSKMFDNMSGYYGEGIGNINSALDGTNDSAILNGLYFGLQNAISKEALYQSFSGASYNKQKGKAFQLTNKFSKGLAELMKDNTSSVPSYTTAQSNTMLDRSNEVSPELYKSEYDKLKTLRAQASVNPSLSKDLEIAERQFSIMNENMSDKFNSLSDDVKNKIFTTSVTDMSLLSPDDNLLVSTLNENSVLGQIKDTALGIPMQASISTSMLPTKHKTMLNIGKSINRDEWVTLSNDELLNRMNQFIEANKGNTDVIPAYINDPSFGRVSTGGNSDSSIMNGVSAFAEKVKNQVNPILNPKSIPTSIYGIGSNIVEMVKDGYNGIPAKSESYFKSTKGQETLTNYINHMKGYIMNRMNDSSITNIPSRTVSKNEVIFSSEENANIKPMRDVALASLFDGSAMIFEDDGIVKALPAKDLEDLKLLFSTPASKEDKENINSPKYSQISLIDTDGAYSDMGTVFNIRYNTKSEKDKEKIVTKSFNFIYNGNSPVVKKVLNDQMNKAYDFVKANPDASGYYSENAIKSIKSMSNIIGNSSPATIVNGSGEESTSGESVNLAKILARAERLDSKSNNNFIQFTLGNNPTRHVITKQDDAYLYTVSVPEITYGASTNYSDAIQGSLKKDKFSIYVSSPREVASLVGGLLSGRSELMKYIEGSVRNTSAKNN